MPLTLSKSVTDNIRGLKELDKKLGKIGTKMGAKVLRKVTREAIKPTLTSMRIKAPRGKVPYHRLHTGEWVTAGHLSRSIVSRSRFQRNLGRVSQLAGVKSSAFYGTQFLDQGPYLVTKRRRKGGGTKAIRPYTIKQHPWFESTFISHNQRMQRTIETKLRAELNRI